MDDALINKLKELGALDKASAKEAITSAKQSGTSITEVLVNLKMVDEEILTQAQAEVKGIPYADLSQQFPDPGLLNLLPPNLIQSYQAIPFAQEGSVIKVGMVEPEDRQAQDAIQFALSPKGFQMQVFMISKGSFQGTVSGQAGNISDMSQEVQNALQSIVEDPSLEEEKIKEVDFVKESNSPVSQIVASLLKHGIESKASDIHIEPGENDIRVRYRVDGVLKTDLQLPLKVKAGLVSRIKILASLKIDEQRKPQDGRFYTKVGGYKIDIRVSTFPSTHGEKVVMRLLDTGNAIQNLENLGFIGQNLVRFKNSLKRTFGMVLVTGPTGSGKSTTLYAALNIVNKVGVNIVTLEDPVEYYLEGANQSQVRPEIGYTFASGLRSILRQDPDIIMVGEIRDSETAELAVHSALTGHLVLSTLHTNTAVGTIPRLVDMGLEPFLITAALNMVCGQRLVKRICEKCKQIDSNPDKKMQAKVMELLKELPDHAKSLLPDKMQFYRGTGCSYCNGKGSKGRIAIHEVLEMDSNIEKMVSANATDAELEIAAKQQGMVTMLQDGIIKALKGIVSLEEVWRVINV